MRLRLEGRLTAATLVLLLLAGRASVAEARRIQQVGSTGRSLRRLQQEETHAEDISSASQAQADLEQGGFELSGVELGDEVSQADLTSTEPQTQEGGLSDSSQQPEEAAGLTDPVLESSRQAAQARDGTDPDSYAADAGESLTLVGDEPATNWTAEANSSTHTEADESKEGILTVPDSLSISLNETAAEVAAAGTNSNHSSHSAGTMAEEGLTFDEAVASSLRNASSEAEDPLIQFPILESTSPVLESSNGTLGGIDQLSLGSVNGSLQASITEPEAASNVTAANNGTSSGVSGLLYAAANASGLGNSSFGAGNLTEILEGGGAIVNATLNSTESLLASAASTASQLLSNTSSIAAAAANLTANSSQHTTAGGLESDLQLPGQLLNGSVDGSTSGVAGSLQLLGQSVNMSAVNGSSVSQLVNSSRTLQDGQERVTTAAGSVVHDSKAAAAGLLSGVRSWFNQNSSNGFNTTLLSGLSSGFNATGNSTGTTGGESTFGQMILEEELGSDSALAAVSGSSTGVHASTGHYSHHNSSSRAAATAANHDRAAGLELSGVSNPAHTAFLSSGADRASSAGLNGSALGHGALAGNTGNDSTAAVISAVLSDPRSSASSTGRATGLAANTSAVNTSALNSAVLHNPNSSASAAGRGSVLALNTSSASTASGTGLGSRAVPGSGSRDQHTGFSDFSSSSAEGAVKQGVISTRAAEREDDFEAGRASAAAGGTSHGGSGLSHVGVGGHSTSFNRDTTLDGSLGSSAQSGAGNQYAGLENAYEDSVLLEEGDKSSGAAANGAGHSGTGSGSAAGGGSRSGTGGSSASGLGMTAAEQREQDRDTAFRASTGSMAVEEQASGGSTGSRYSGLPGAASQSWGQLASKSHSGSTVTLHSDHPSGASSGTRQQAVAGHASELAYDDEESSAGIGASSGHSQVTGSGSSTGGGHSSGAGHRDPTNPNSVVEAHSAWMAQPHSALPRDGLAGSGSLTAGNSQVSLAGGLGAHSGAGHTNHLEADSDSTDGPLLVGGKEQDELLPQATGSGRQSYSSMSQQRSLLDIIVDNWVVLSAFVALVGTGTVLGFVFVRGMMPNPLDAISFSNVGTSGYVGNSKYISLGQEEEGSGWENGWGMDDAPRSSSASHTTSSSGSPPRATGMGKLKKGTFAKKKPEKKPSSWSNDF